MSCRPQSRVQPWFVILLLVIGLLPIVTAGRAPQRASAAPAGLTAAEWQAIQAQLPPAQQAYLKASNTGNGDQFGIRVAVSGDTVVVGANGESSSTRGVNSTPDEAASTSGAAYVFVRSAGVWMQQAYLKASNTGAGDNFGYSVAVSGDTVVVGAIGEDSSSSGVNGDQTNNAADSAGAAYVFTRTGTTWTQQAYLKASNPDINDDFGSRVAVAGDTVVVSATFEDSSSAGINSTPNEAASLAGAAYVFARTGTTWSQQAYLKASNPGEDDFFGDSVGVSGDTVVVGAWNEDSSTTGVNSPPDEAASGAGAAYLFVRTGATWSQQAYLKASNTGGGDRFGYSVAVDGATVVVGAMAEDSSTSGINGVPNEDASAAGAAYVFTRSGTTWSQQAYLKASNPQSIDLFGVSVAVSGDTVVVSAPEEDSSTTGINSIPNEAADGAGAAYVFVRSDAQGAPIWSQQAYLKASNAGADDTFASVSVSGDTIVVGAGGEDSSSSGVNSTPNEAADSAGAAYVFAGLGAPLPPTLTPTTPPTATASPAPTSTATPPTATASPAPTLTPTTPPTATASPAPTSTPTSTLLPPRRLTLPLIIVGQ
jgi:hypothetical protein